MKHWPQPIANGTAEDPSDVQRVERFQSLSAGQYWRARVDDAEQRVDAGEVLLVESLRWVDDAVHTVVLRAHPLKYGKKPQGSWRELEEHRFLLADFLAKFEFEPDAARIRADEVSAVQARIASLQADLLSAQRDPQVLAQVVAEELRRPRLAGAEKDQPSGQLVQPAAQNLEVSAEGRDLVDPSSFQSAAQIGTLTVGQAISTGLQPADVDHLRESAQREYQVATIKAQWIQSKTTAIAEAVRGMTPFFSEQAAAALAATEDVRAYVTDLLRGIESLDLYVGKGVQVQTLREGASAPADVPLTFVQKKLLMDEELAVWAAIDEAFDVESDAVFVQALREHAPFVEQIFPTPRCVLVMATTHRHIDYGHELTNALMEEQNRKVFLLVRDGDNVYRVYSSVETHLRAARLFPTKDEHEGIFKGLDGTTTRFEDISYTDRMAEHELFALHYRRFLILACGLDHRLKLFGTFYPGPASMAFLSMAFQERYCRFLYDDDASTQIAGPQSRPKLLEWIASKNAYLRSGSRVLCNWTSLLTPDSAPGVCKASGYRSERKVDVLEGPSVKVAFKDGKDLCVQVQASRERRRNEDAQAFQARVALTAYKPNKWDGVSDEMPFLVLDAVTLDELRWYLHHRASRSNQILYIRLFKRAMAFIERELAEQAQARASLRAALVGASLVPEEQCDDIVQRAVTAWQAANRGQSLPNFHEGASGEQAKAWKALLDQMFLLVRQGSAPVQPAGELALASLRRPLRLAVTGKGKYVLYASANDSERDDRGQPFAWVHRSVLEIGKRGKAREASSGWVRLPRNTAAETTVHVWDEALHERMLEASETLLAFKSPQHKAAMFSHLDAWQAKAAQWASPLEEEEFERRLRHYRSHRREDLQVTIPLGIFTSAKTAKVLCAQADLGLLLGRLAPSSAARARVRCAYAEIYVREDLHKELFDAALRRSSNWQIGYLPAEGFDFEQVFAEEFSRTIQVAPLVEPLLSEKLGAYLGSEDVRKMATSQQESLELASSLHGNLVALDQALNLRRPHDYAPTRLTTLTLSTGTTYDSKVAILVVAPLGRKIPEGLPKAFGANGFGTQQQDFETREQAREAALEIRKEDRLRHLGPTVSALDRPDLPQSPSPDVDLYYAFEEALSESSS